MLKQIIIINKKKGKIQRIEKEEKTQIKSE